MREGRLRTILRQLHLWVGLGLAIPFILIGLSGSVLVLQPDAPLLSMPHAPGRGDVRSPDDILAVAQSALPEGARPTRLSLPQHTGEPATLRFNRPGEGGGQGGGAVWVDAVTLQVLGVGEQRRPAWIFGVARTLHATLYVRSISDRAFVGWLGVGMTLLSLSGLVLWWPRKGRWRGAFTVRPRLRGFRLHHDVHAAFGFWTLLLMLVISVSGVYLAFPRSFRAAVGTVLPLGQTFLDGAEFAPAPGSAPLSLNDAVALSRTAVPRIEPLSFQIPRPGQLLVMTFAPEGYGAGAPTIMVSVDPQTRQLAYIDDPRTYALGERVITWQRQLHSGLGLGVLYKALVFLSGLLPLLFAVTGFRMWWLKRANRRVLVGLGVPEAAQ